MQRPPPPPLKAVFGGVEYVKARRRVLRREQKVEKPRIGLSQNVLPSCQYSLQGKNEWVRGIFS